VSEAWFSKRVCEAKELKILLRSQHAIVQILGNNQLCAERKDNNFTTYDANKLLNPQNLQKVCRG
jgi:hypothetical protein